MLANERLDLGNESRGLRQLESRVDSLLDRLQPQLLDPLDLAACELLVFEACERPPAPERERV
jgi:hypothetical protein